MSFLIDTNVISESVRPRPNLTVLNWIADQDKSRLILSAVTIGEIRRGIERLHSGSKKAHLQNWLEELRFKFSGRILPLTEETFSIWGKMFVGFEAKGLARPLLDSMLEATALEHDLILVTRNARNFKGSSVTILNPWQE
jgi:predicted nucleic acid-binding protein